MLSPPEQAARLSTALKRLALPPVRLGGLSAVIGLASDCPALEVLEVEVHEGPLPLTEVAGGLRDPERPLVLEGAPVSSKKRRQRLRQPVPNEIQDEERSLKEGTDGEGGGSLPAVEKMLQDRYIEVPDPITRHQTIRAPFLPSYLQRGPPTIKWKPHA